MWISFSLDLFHYQIYYSTSVKVSVSRGRPAVVTRSGEDGGRTTCVISLRQLLWTKTQLMMVRIWHPSWFFSIMIVMANSWLSSYFQNIKLMKPQGRHDEIVQGSSWSRLDNDTIRGQSLSGFLKTIWHYPHNSYHFLTFPPSSSEVSSGIRLKMHVRKLSLRDL